MKTIYYWSPCLTKVGTHKSTVNSAVSLAKYSRDLYSVKIINICGEWNNEKKFFQKNGIDVINLGFNYFNYLPKTGFIKTRISYFIIIIMSVLPLFFLIKKKKPDFLIIHLITSLPLLIHKFINNKTKLVLRISGFPKLSYFRKFIWKISSKKIFKITTPTIELKKQLIKKKIFSEEDVIFLPDPIIEVKNFSRKKIFYGKKEKKFFISVGRLTKQKNFSYLINEFNEFVKINSNYNLYIFGSGEEEKNLRSQIIKKKLEKKIFLMGYSTKINQYMKKAEAFILSSLWEDPGFVLIEAAMNNLFIISSNCKNGPEEFLKNGQGGLLFESNKKDALLNSLKKFTNINELKAIMKIKLNAKKNCKNYTLINHFKIMNFEILKN